MFPTFSAPTRLWIAVQQRACTHDERGSQTAEYGVTILVAVAFALSVLALITGGAFDTVLQTLIKAVLSRANHMVGD